MLTTPKLKQNSPCVTYFSHHWDRTPSTSDSGERNYFSSHFHGGKGMTLLKVDKVASIHSSGDVRWLVHVSMDQEVESTVRKQKLSPPIALNPAPKTSASSAPFPKSSPASQNSATNWRSSVPTPESVRSVPHLKH